jgi:hypothetical protein|tara:strand:+ start:554 stop:766 length:213 start_codon:yes stop_codon:yes gene_type:complete
MIIRRFITFVIAVSLAFSVSTAMAGKSDKNDKCSYKAQCWPLAERKLLDKWAANTTGLWQCKDRSNDEIL